MEDQVTKNQSELNETNHNFENITTIGIFLKSEREKKNLTLKQISQKTKINLTQLEYLEDDKLDLLPNRAYVVGYLKSYSKALGIEHALPMACLEKTYTILHPVIKPVIQEKQTPEPTNNKLYLIITAIIVITILFFILVANVTKTKMKTKNKASEESQPSSMVSSTGQTEDTSNSVATNESSNSVISQTATNNNLSSNPALNTSKPITANEPTEKKTETKPQENTLLTKTEEKDKGKNNQDTKDKEKSDTEKKYDFSPMQKNLYSIAQNPSEEKLSLFPKEAKGNIIPGKQNVLIHAHKGDSWITYQIDERDPRQKVLTQNTSVNLVGDTVKVFFGNVNATTVFLNGKLINIDTKTGVRNLVFPEEKSSKYVFPLFIFNKETGEIITSEEYLKENPIKKN